MLALSVNSPFFEGYNTGMKSSRTFQFGLFPRTEIPVFLKSFSDYERIINNYIKAKSIGKPRHIWWKIRPHIDYNTVEFRVCEAQRSLENVEMIIGLIQALVRSIDIKKDYNLNYQYEYLTDSLWKSSSHGLDCTIIDPYDNKIIPMNEMVNRMIDYCNDSLNYFGNMHIVKYVNNIISNGTEADEQLRVFSKNNIDFLKKYLIDNVQYKI